MGSTKVIPSPRRKHTEHVQGVEFFTLPGLLIEDSCHPQAIACNEWIKICGRPYSELNENVILGDKVKGNCLLKQGQYLFSFALHAPLYNNEL